LDKKRSHFPIPSSNHTFSSQSNRTFKRQNDRNFKA
jgi:hypothetical protein